jgi:hypothetical protein
LYRFRTAPDRGWIEAGKTNAGDADEDFEVVQVIGLMLGEMFKSGSQALIVHEAPLVELMVRRHLQTWSSPPM